MTVVNMSELSQESKIGCLEREIRWYKSELEKVQIWLNNSANRMRGTFDDVVKRSRGLQFELHEKEQELEYLKGMQS